MSDRSPLLLRGALFSCMSSPASRIPKSSNFQNTQTYPNTTQEIRARVFWGYILGYPLGISYVFGDFGALRAGEIIALVSEFHKFSGPAVLSLMCFCYSIRQNFRNSYRETYCAPQILHSLNNILEKFWLTIRMVVALVFWGFDVHFPTPDPSFSRIANGCYLHMCSALFPQISSITLFAFHGTWAEHMFLMFSFLWNVKIGRSSACMPPLLGHFWPLLSNLQFWLHPPCFWGRVLIGLSLWCLVSCFCCSMEVPQYSGERCINLNLGRCWGVHLSELGLSRRPYQEPAPLPPPPSESNT